MTEQNTAAMSVEEMVDSLTGFEEIAIEKGFGSDITTLLITKSTTALRGLVFIIHKREGKSDSEARKAVMEMRLGDVQNYFPDEQPEVTPDEPVTDEGKDDSQPD